MIYKYGKPARDSLGRFYFYCNLIFYILEAILMKQLFHLRSKFFSSYALRKLFASWCKLMSADKYPSIFSRQMEAIVYIANARSWNKCFKILIESLDTPSLQSGLLIRSRTLSLMLLFGACSAWWCWA